MEVKNTHQLTSRGIIRHIGHSAHQICRQHANNYDSVKCVPMTITAATWLYVWVVIHYTVKDSFFYHGKIYAVSYGFVGYVEMFDLDASKWTTITAVVVSYVRMQTR